MLVLLVAHYLSTFLNEIQSPLKPIIAVAVDAMQYIAGCDSEEGSSLKEQDSSFSSPPLFYADDSLEAKWS